MSYKLRPLGSDILKIVVQIFIAFDWNAKTHGSGEPFWLWVEDQEGLMILQMSRLTLRPSSNRTQNDFVISIPDGQPPAQVVVRFSSDKWLGADDELIVPMESLVMPPPSTSHSPLLDVPLLSLTVLGNQLVEDFFAKRIFDFNGIQTQVIWTLVRTNLDTLVCAPTGSGKTTLALISIWFGLSFFASF
jgi:antiviral helicase SLH1